MVDNDKSSASHRNNKNLCNRKFFTAEDVLAAVLGSGDDSGSDSEFSTKIVKLTMEIIK